MVLPVNIDSTYGDSVADATVKTHQQHHDEIHTFINDTAAGFQSGVYTPTLSGMAIGTGGGALNTANYVYVGDPAAGGVGIMRVTGTIIFGTSGASFPSSGTVALPSGFAIWAGNTLNRMGQAIFEDAGANYVEGLMRLGTSSSFIFDYILASANDARLGSVSPTVPFTWVAGDKIYWDASCTAVRV